MSTADQASSKDGSFPRSDVRAPMAGGRRCGGFKPPLGAGGRCGPSRLPVMGQGTWRCWKTPALAHRRGLLPLENRRVDEADDSRACFRRAHRPADRRPTPPTCSDPRTSSPPADTGQGGACSRQLGVQQRLLFEHSFLCPADGHYPAWWRARDLVPAEKQPVWIAQHRPAWSWWM